MPLAIKNIFKMLDGGARAFDSNLLVSVDCAPMGHSKRQG